MSQQLSLVYSKNQFIWVERDTILSTSLKYYPQMLNVLSSLFGNGSHIVLVNFYNFAYHVPEIIVHGTLKGRPGIISPKGIPKYL
jgi:hypothetical protein